MTGVALYALSVIVMLLALLGILVHMHELEQAKRECEEYDDSVSRWRALTDR